MAVASNLFQIYVKGSPDHRIVIKNNSWLCPNISGITRSIKDPKLVVQKNWEVTYLHGHSDHIVTAVVITDRYGHGHNEFAPLVNKTAQNFTLSFYRQAGFENSSYL
jgi:hypothetical protein